PSPTTVSAVKVNWRPPLTVLETRLTAMSFSIIPSSISSRLWRPRESRSFAIVVSCIEEVVTASAACSWEIHRAFRSRREPAAPSGATRAGGTTTHGACAPCVQASELQAAFARGVGQRLDAAVVAVAGTVEGDLLDARGLGLLGDDATDLGGSFGVLGALQPFADVGLGGARRGKDLRAVRAEQLRIDVLAGAQHRQARNAQLADMRAGRRGAAQACGFLVHLVAPG